MDTDALLNTDENKQNIEDIKALNQINLAEIIPVKAPKSEEKKKAEPEEESKEENKAEADDPALTIITTTAASSATQ